MIDIITHIPDLVAFRVEAKAKAEAGTLGFMLNSEGNGVCIAPKIPVHYKLNTSLCLIRLMTEEEETVFDNLTTCHRLGVVSGSTYDFDSPADQAIYESIYDITTRDIDGEPYTPPYNIGLFA